MKLKFVKLVRVPVTFQLSDGTEREGYRYMDIDGRIIAESLKQEPYPSAVRELEQEIRMEVEAKKAKEAEKAQADKMEQEAQAEWDAMRAQMKAALVKRGSS